MRPWSALLRLSLPRRLLLLGALLLVVSGLAQANPPEGPQQRGTNEEAQRLLSVIAPYGTFKADVSDNGYVFGLSDGPERIGNLVVAFSRPGGDRPRVRTRHYLVEIGALTPSENVVRVLVQAADALVAADGGALPEEAVEMIQQPKQELLFTALLMAAIAVALGVVKRGRISLDIRKPHVIQACVHTSIFIYWSRYWPAVHYQAPIILLMILLAYASDAAFAFAKFGSWRLGLSPLPVVFSTNLFVWLDWKGAVLAMVGAFAMKTYVQRNGHHIFNPSVAGLTLNALCTILLPGVVHFGGLFHTLNIAPSMAEWIFLGSLIPLTVFRLLPVSIGSIIGLYYLTHAPGAVRPTLLLMMTLLATDPATTPKSDLGRLLFGVMVGSTYIVFRHLLRYLGQPDDFAKILSVPIPNLLVPQFDWLATRIQTAAKNWWARFWPEAARQLGGLRPSFERIGRFFNPVPNGVYVAVWVALFSYALHEEKPLDYEPALHWTWGTPLVARDTDGVPRCESNPVFCHPFSFLDEAKAWTSRSSATVAHQGGP